MSRTSEKIKGLNFNSVVIIVTTIEDEQLTLESDFWKENYRLTYYKGQHLYTILSDKWMYKNSYHDCSELFWRNIGAAIQYEYADFLGKTRVRKLDVRIEIESNIQPNHEPQKEYLLELSAEDFYLNDLWGNSNAKVYIRPTTSKFSGKLPERHLLPRIY